MKTSRSIQFFTMLVLVSVTFGRKFFLESRL